MDIIKTKLKEILLGIIIGDFITAFFHWLEDSYLEPHKIKNKFLYNIAIENEFHHFIPRSILSCSHFYNIRITTFISFIALILFNLLAKDFFKKNFISIIVCLFIISISNLIHRFSHLRIQELNPILYFLQKNNIIISNDEHRIHHAENPYIKFGVINKYTNYIYDYFMIWNKFEKLFYLLFGIKPTKKGKVSDYYNLYDEKLKKNMNLKIPKILTKEELLYYKNKLIDHINQI
jgi:hypothetical protein